MLNILHAIKVLEHLCLKLVTQVCSDQYWYAIMWLLDYLCVILDIIHGKTGKSFQTEIQVFVILLLAKHRQVSPDSLETTLWSLSGSRKKGSGSHSLGSWQSRTALYLLHSVFSSRSTRWPMRKDDVQSMHNWFASFC